MPTSKVASLLPLLLACSLSTGAAAEIEVEVLRDIDYLKDTDYADNKDKLDLYRAAGAASAPVLVYLHGGALQAGDKSQQGHVGRFFAEHGYIVACVNYRLSPGVIHPAHTEDAAASFAWVIRNIERYGGDPNRVALAGHSAGAYLAALLALDGRYLEGQGLAVSSIKAVVPISGFFHLERIAPDRPKTVWGESEAAWKEASPSQYVSATAPPILLLYADGDVVERRQESLDLAAELESSGHRQVETHQISDRTHSTIARQLGEDGDPSAKHMLRFLKEILGH